MERVLSTDEVICREYAKTHHTADEIVSDPSLANDFCHEVNAYLPSDLRFDIAGLNKRLLNLRRRGEENGGLIRKHRRFHGRNRKSR